MSASDLPRATALSDAMPNIWIGYLLVLGLFLMQFGVGIVSDLEHVDIGSPPARYLALLYPFSLGGLSYWLFCIYRFHVVLARATNHSYPIKPGRAAFYHFIPFYGLYWMFKWTNEVARFINTRAGVRRMRKGWTGVFLLMGFILSRLDVVIGQFVLFSVAMYVQHKIRRALALEVVNTRISEQLRAVIPQAVQYLDVAMSAGLGGGFGIILYNALREFRIVQMVFIGLILLAGIVLVDPLIDHFAKISGVTLHSSLSNPVSKKGLIQSGILSLPLILLYMLETEISHKPIHETLALLIMALLTAGGITHAWVRGIMIVPPRAAAFGIWAGAFLGFFIGFVFFVLGAVKPTITSTILSDAIRWFLPFPYGHGLSANIESENLLSGSLFNGFQWGVLGLAGGMAVDRRVPHLIDRVLRLPLFSRLEEVLKMNLSILLFLLIGAGLTAMAAYFFGKEILEQVLTISFGWWFGLWANYRSFRLLSMTTAALSPQPSGWIGSI